MRLSLVAVCFSSLPLAAATLSTARAHARVARIAFWNACARRASLVIAMCCLRRNWVAHANSLWGTKRSISAGFLALEISFYFGFLVSIKEQEPRAATSR